ncbi:MAG: hypothetical protein K8T89_11245 [Planctomycetes bacterium]|nr:hypothetical protein [Planctomycetota bacterium]
MTTPTLEAVVHNGRVNTEAPADWPEGTNVRIEPVRADELSGMREEDWPTTPEGIAALVQSWNEMEPLEFTPEEEAGLNAWRQKVKEYTIANMNKDLEAPGE